MVARRRTEDIDACAALLALVHEADAYPMRWPADPARWLTPRELLCAWVARRDGDVVGHVCLCRAEEDASAAIWSASVGCPVDGLGVVSRLFVAPGARRAGLGRALLRAAGDEARGRGLHPVLDVLEALDHGRAAAALYERLGWRRVGPAAAELGRFVAP